MPHRDAFVTAAERLSNYWLTHNILRYYRLCQKYDHHETVIKGNMKEVKSLNTPCRVTHAKQGVHNLKSTCSSLINKCSKKESMPHKDAFFTAVERLSDYWLIQNILCYYLLYTRSKFVMKRVIMGNYVKEFGASTSQCISCNKVRSCKVGGPFRMQGMFSSKQRFTCLWKLLLFASKSLGNFFLSIQGRAKPMRDHCKNKTSLSHDCNAYSCYVHHFHNSESICPWKLLKSPSVVPSHEHASARKVAASGLSTRGKSILKIGIRELRLFLGLMIQGGNSIDFSGSRDKTRAKTGANSRPCFVTIESGPES